VEHVAVIAVESAGAITPVGTNLTDTMIGLYTGVQLFDDLGLCDEDGEPLSGMKVRFADSPVGPERIAAMAHAVVDQATLTIEPTAKVPLFLCAPEVAAFAGESADWPTDLLNDVVAKAAVPLDPARSRIIPRGRAGVLEALGAALAMLKDPALPCCLVGGVDSFVHDSRVSDLFADERLLTVRNKEGYVPGEAGAMLLLTNRPSPDALALWLSAAAGREEACRGSERPITGAGLQNAMAKALSLAGLEFDALDCVAHDFSGEQRCFEELLQARTRLSNGKGSPATEDPGMSVGETGAAAGFLAIAMMAFLHQKAVHKHASMAVLSSDGPERGAVVLGAIARR
jgi:3-oxoacyl-[acyl-carrier-protein] synthase I